MKQPIIQQIPSNIYFGNIDNPLRGTNLIDPPIIHEDKYNWIRDDSRTEKKVLDFLNDENEYTRYIMEDREQEVENIYTELLSNIKEDYDSYPFPPSFDRALPRSYPGPQEEGVCWLVCLGILKIDRLICYWYSYSFFLKQMY